MNAVERLQRASAKVLRPVSGIRGAGRICKLLNNGLLRAGAPPVQVARMRDGTQMRLDLRSQTEWYAYYSGRYDDAAIVLIRRLLGSLGGDFLDVGGNIGMYVVRVAAGFETERRYVSFEPVPRNAERIRENSVLNGLGERIEVHEIALSDTNGTTKLVLREDFAMGSDTGNASIAISEAADGSFRKIDVQTLRFDDFLDNNEDVLFRVSKVDIEGHEDYFFRGATAWLSRERPVILTEVNNWFYQKRGTTSTAVFSTSLPSHYQAALLRGDESALILEETSIADFADFAQLETCLLYPAELRDLVHQVGGKNPSA